MFVASFFSLPSALTLTRFRLRFLLQEIDLPQGDTLIGRSASCQVTLDDPLVSREHACIRIAGTSAMVQDLRSRNGVQLGGQLINRSAPLSSGDRIRIGTQELVFLELPASAEHSSPGMNRNTGFMCHCAGCARAYPDELVACPACGSKERLEEDTLTGAGQRDWGIELAAQAVNRARVAGTGDLERVLAHARLGLEQRLAEGRAVDRELIDNVAMAAAEIAVKRSEAGWGRWALSIYASLSWVPPAALSQALLQLPKGELVLLAPAVQRCRESAGSRLTDEDRASLDALLRLLESVES